MWSFCGFIILFLFYSRNPAIAARRLVDFAPAIAIGIVILYIYIVNFIRYILPEVFSLRINITLSAVFLVWIFASLSNLMVLPLYGHLSKVELTNATTARIARENLSTSKKRTTGPSLPIGYSCGDLESKYGIPDNNTGWDISSSCMVSLVTTHFLDNPKCLAIYIEPIGGIPDWVTKNYSDEEIEIKMGLERLRRISGVPFENGKVIKYCSEKSNNDDNEIYKKFKLISIRWLHLQRHPNLSSPPLMLISLEKVQ